MNELVNFWLDCKNFFSFTNLLAANYREITILYGNFIYIRLSLRSLQIPTINRLIEGSNRILILLLNQPPMAALIIATIPTALPISGLLLSQWPLETINTAHRGSILAHIM